jgi:glycosyltransferase involved in cell wall biosynthesis
MVAGNVPKTIVAIDARLFGGTSTGDSTYWTELIHELSTVDSNALFLLYSNAPSPIEIPKSSKIRWVLLPSRSSRWWSFVLFPLAARKAGAHVLHAQYNVSPLARNPVLTVHDVSFFIDPGWFRSKDRWLLSVGVPRSIARAKRVIAVSKTCKVEIERFVPGAIGKVIAIPNACPTWIQRQNREEARDRLTRLGVPDPFLLTVGTRWPRKNMRLAIDACDLLESSIPHRLCVTGKTGWGDQELGGRGFATGYVSQKTLCDLYSVADLYLATSLHEGFGIPVLEAMRCGCPVLSSSGGALPEVVADAGFVEANWDAASWSKTIGDLLSDPSRLQSLRERGLKRVNDFSWTTTAQQTFAQYEEACR